MLSLLGRPTGRERGDTIVEVLISLAILSLAFSISYATANRSLMIARNSEEHSEALQYLASQAELVRADAADSTLYTATTPRCMDPVTSSSTYGKPIAGGSSNCTISYYTLSFTYSPAPDGLGINQDIFTFKVNWQGAGTLGPQQETLSYKIHKP